MSLTFPFASNLFGLDSSSQTYLIPRPKFLYYVSFILNQSYQLNPENIPRLGYLVKSIERPKFHYKTLEIDQYNRKRLFHTKVEYQPVSFTFYDTVDSVVQQLLDDYNRHNFNDFSNVVPGDNNQYWSNNLIEGADMNYWGYRLKNPTNYQTGPSGRGLPTAENFFQEIRIYEFYGNNFSQYTLINPKLDSVSQDNNDSTSIGEFTEVTFTVNPEGIVYNYIDAPIELSVVAQTIMPGAGFSTNNFPIAELNLTDYLANSIARAGGGLLTDMVNGVFGSFGSLNSSIGSGIGILGGAALQVAAAGYLGTGLGSSPTSAGVLFAGTYAASSLLPLAPVVASNALSGIESITSSGSSIISSGLSSIGAAAQSVEDSISSLW